MVVPYAAIAFDAPSHAASVGVFFGISSLVVLYRMHSALVRRQTSWRRRIENVTVVTGAVAVFAGWAVRADLGYVLFAYLAWAGLLAWPGAVSGLLREGRALGDRWRVGKVARDPA